MQRSDKRSRYSPDREEIPDIDVHRYEKNLKAAKKHAKSRISKKNYDLLEEYDDEMVRCAFAKATRLKHVKTILVLTEFNDDIYWKDTTRKDIRKLLTRIMEYYSKKTGRETNTTYDCKKILKLFVRYTFTGRREIEQHKGELKILWDVKGKRVKNTLVKEDMIDDNDMMKLSKACGMDVCFRALLWVAFDAGTRPSELLTLTIGDVRQKADGWIIAVDGKTGQRIIHLVKSVPYLSQWINMHPYFDNPKWPLWIYTQNPHYGKPLSYDKTDKKFKDVARKSNINKKVFLNLMRHSEITLTSKFMPDALLKKRHGWSATSKTPANYQHLNQDDVRDVLFSHFNMKTEDVPPEAEKICQNCAQRNGLAENICNFCHMPLSLEGVMKIKEDAQKEKEKLIEDTRIATRKEVLKILKLERKKFFEDNSKKSDHRDKLP